MDAAVLRSAVEADLERITAIYGHAVRYGTSSYEIDPPSRDEMRERFRTLTLQGYPYLVAEAGGAVLGYAYAAPFRPRPAYRHTVEDSIYVAPEATGRGIGRQLLSHLIGEVSRLGFRQLVAVIGDGTPSSPSVRLHLALGFRHAGTLAASGHKYGRWLDTVFMQLELNGGAGSPPDPASLGERLARG